MNKIEWLKHIDKEVELGPFKDSWESLNNYKIPAWYENAKFGIFIHWGVYSVPAFGNEWYPRNMYQQGSKEFEYHINTYGAQAKFGYKDFIPMFKAERFDPNSWIDLFSKSGAKYIVPVAEHHDGFQMYKSELSNWNAFNMGPRRDIISELSQESKKQGLIFGVSSHRAEHWWFFDGGMKFDSDVKDPKYKDFYGPAHQAPSKFDDFEEYEGPDQEFLEDWLIRTCELVNKYHPQIVYFDWWINHKAFKPYLKKFAAYYYNQASRWNKEVAINYKFDAFPKNSAVFDVERGQLEGISNLFWQTDTSISKKSWGYIDNDEYKNANEIISALVDIVSKNGALLLNVGPRADGIIPEEAQKIFLEIGRWLNINGEAIYGTHPWKIFGEGPTRIKEGAFTDNEMTFTSQDIRFTTKDENLYVIVMKQPEKNLIKINSLGRSRDKALKINSVSLLEEGHIVKWTHDENDLTIQIAKKKSEYPVVFKLSVDEKL
ncbi:MAG: alpha-L-fucosidase [Candidatus Parvarchaeota archaeon]